MVHVAAPVTLWLPPPSAAARTRGGAGTPVTAATAATADDADAAPLPAEDDQLRRWRAIHADDDQPPAGTTAAALLPELVGYLGSPDPERRDGIAYEVLVAWIVRAPRLTPAELRPLAGELVAALDGPLDVPDGVFRRSFSALVLSLIVKRDLDDPFFTDAERRDLLAAARAYAGREPDLRGHTGVRGWAHAAAHTADLLKFLAREPAFTDDDRAVVLDAVAALVVRRHGFDFHHGEDGRLALPVLEVLRRGVAAAGVDAWLDAIVAPLREPGTADFDPALFAAQRNARNLLFTLFVQLSLTPSPGDGERHALDRLRALLAG